MRNQPPTEQDKQHDLNEIKKSLNLLYGKGGGPDPRDPLYVEELEWQEHEIQNAVANIAYHYVKLMSWGHDYAERVRKRIQANMPARDYIEFETEVSDFLRRRSQR